MRHRTWLAFAVIVAVVPLAAGHAWRPAAGAPFVIPGVALADIQLGTPIGEVLTRFGTPSVVRLTARDGMLGYGFDHYGITVYVQSDVVEAVATTNSVLGSIDGIGLGTPTSDIVRTLGPAYSRGAVEGFPGVIYRGLGLGFGLDRQGVAAIVVFRAVAATPVRPASPALPGPGVPAAPGLPTSPALPASPVQPSSPTLPAGAVTGSAGGKSPAAGPAAAPASAVVAATANPGASAMLPDVSNLKAYSAATHFLSLSGYLRYLVYGTSKTWITPADSEHLIQRSGPSIP